MENTHSRRRRRGSGDTRPRWLEARYSGRCAETGRAVSPGTRVLWFPATREIYMADTRTAEEWRSQSFADAAGLADANW
jgi:hypothetical protein